MNDIVLYASKGWSAVLAILCLILLLLFVGILVSQSELHTEGGTLVKVAIGSVLLVGALGRNVYRMFNPVPRLIVNRDGITENATMQKVGLIPWTDIADITVYRDHGFTLLGILLKDPESFYRRLPAEKVDALRSTFQRKSVHIGIPQASLSVPVDDLKRQIMSYREVVMGAPVRVSVSPGSVAAAPPDATPSLRCNSCGATSQNTKFCPECGQPMPRARACSQCGTEVKATTKFCPECGSKI